MSKRRVGEETWRNENFEISIYYAKFRILYIYPGWKQAYRIPKKILRFHVWLDISTEQEVKSKGNLQTDRVRNESDPRTM